MVDQIALLLLILLCGLSIFALRRWRDLRKEQSRRKKLESSIQAREDAYKQIIEQADEMIYRTDAKGHFILISPSVEKILNYSESELTGRHYLELINPGEHEEIARFYKEQFLKRRPSTYREFTAITKDGGEVLIGQTVQLLNEDGRITGFQAVAQDLTRRRQAEEAARKMEEYRNLFKLANDPILIFDLAGNVLDVNDKACATYRIPRADIIRMNIEDLSLEPEVSRQRFEKMRVGETFEEFETIQRRADGAPLYFLINPTAIEYQGQRAILRINRDVTQRKEIEAEQERLQSERDQLLEQLQIQIEVMPMAFILTDSTHRTCYWNPAAERIFGYSKQEMIGEYSHRLLVPPDSQPYIEKIFQEIANGESLSSSFTENVTKDGRQLTCEWYTTPLKKSDGKFLGIMSMAHDVTDFRRMEMERQKKEEQLRQAQKMEAVGQLAGGIAHDFNNLLTAINGYADITLKRLPEIDPLRQNVEQIRKAGLRAASLTRQLLAFSRKQVLQAKILDLNEVVQDMDKMLRRLIGEDIDLVTLPLRDLGKVKADPGQIEQILLNLVVNARDAMPRGGKITIETNNAYLDGVYAARHLSVQPGNYIRLSVSDTGVGMNERIRSQIFEPFFTTKEPGKGTGLGLSTVYGIVKQSGGSIWVYSEPGQGTTFKIYLPRVDEVTEFEESTDSQTVRGTGTILLVEDESIVRELSKTILEDLGYNVFVAENGVEALSVCKEIEEPIDLLITDVVMPEMSGRELTEEFAKLYPQTKVLYMSGYTDDAIVRHGILEQEMPFLQKPFLPDLLAHKARELLDDGTATHRS
jgi:PAS domain S-box-containing protein